MVVYSDNFKGVILSLDLNTKLLRIKVIREFS